MTTTAGTTTDPNATFPGETLTNADNNSVLRVCVLCCADNLRDSIAQAYGPGYADVDPARLARQLADARGWQITKTRIYASTTHPSPDRSDSARERAAWLRRIGATPAQLITQPGDITIRMALDGAQFLRERQTDILLILGGPASFMALAQDTRTTARQQQRNVRFASAFAPSAHTCGKAIPSADLSVSIDRASVEKSLLLTSGPQRPRRIYAGRPTPPAPAPVIPLAHKLRSRPLRALYGMGLTASLMALVWEDIVQVGGNAALAWDAWRWGVSIALALSKSIVWPLYWLARLFGIEAGG